MEFSIEPIQPQIDPLVINKNIKELKVGSGEKFFVDSKGNMFATSGTFSGDITGASGTFGGAISVGGGQFTISKDGVMQIKDSNGDVVIKINPNG